MRTTIWMMFGLAALAALFETADVVSTRCDAALVEDGGTVPENVWKTGGDAWTPCEGGSVSGDRAAVVVVPGGSAERCNTLRRTVDLSPFAGKGLCAASILARAKDVSKPRASYNGVKFMLFYTDPSGQPMYPGAGAPVGTFDWRKLTFTFSIPSGVAEGILNLGLQDSSGEVEFDLSSLTVQSVFPVDDSDYRCVYSDRVAKHPVLHGVMSPNQVLDEDLDTLKSWGATLLRYQMNRNWGVADAERDLEDYDRWLDGKLDHLAEILPKAEARGIAVVVDLHTPPGGRYADSTMAMFQEAEYGEHFVEVWRRIASRFKGNPAVWGYDLINEPVQNGPAEYCDYWTLQKRAAEAVREIDPTVPIILESNGWDSPDTFSYLRPLEMPDVIYQAHMYNPHSFTHQGVGHTPLSGLAYPSEGLDKEFLRKRLAPVLEFQRRHGARIYIGEFSAIAWAPGAEAYIRDLTELFGEYGWDWSYHAFREWDGWSVEHEAFDGKKLRKSDDNPRKRALLEAF